MTTVDSGEAPPGMLGQIEVDERTWWQRSNEAFSLRSAGAVYALILLVGFFTIRTAQLGRGNYLAAGNVGNVLEQSSLIGIMAIGMTVLLISGNFDLSVASNAAMSAMAAAMMVDTVGPAWAVVIAVAVGTVGGLINGLIHWYVGLNSFIVTLGTLTAYRGLVLYMNNGEERLIATREYRETLKSWAGGFVGSVEVALLVAIGFIIAAGVFAAGRQRGLAVGSGVVAAAALIVTVATDYRVRIAHQTFYLFILLALVWFVLRFTVTGRRLYATGGNMEAARAAGIVVARYRVVPFILVGFCAGVAGVMFLSRVGTVPPSMLTARELEVIASAIIGGVALTGGSGSVIKSMIGALLLFVMTNGFTIIGLSPFLQEIAIGALVILSAALYVVASRRAAAAGRV
ncbi:MAG: ABC transporter permease [Actinomycetota bacterium]